MRVERKTYVSGPMVTEVSVNHRHSSDCHKGVRKSECELDGMWSEKFRFAEL